jgi:hypothetical protein
MDFNLWKKHFISQDTNLDQFFNMIKNLSIFISVVLHGNHVITLQLIKSVKSKTLKFVFIK